MSVMLRPGFDWEVFLDELADIPLPVQAKMVRVLEYSEVLPVGGNQPQALQLRVLSATHQDLPREVEQGRFRHDLFFRLNGFQIQLPPLRERGNDIIELAHHFVRLLEPRSLPLPPETLQLLKTRRWPGNVRELENLIERVVAFSTGTTVAHTDVHGWLHHAVSPQQSQGLPTDLPEDGLDLEGLINGIEKDLLMKALERSKWVKKKAARLLKLNTRSFRYRLEKYAIKGGRD